MTTYLPASGHEPSFVRGITALDTDLPVTILTAEITDDAQLVRPDLAPREKEVLVAWLHTDNKECVARTLFISTATVRTHLQRIRGKYAAVGRPAPTKAALVARAVQDGLIDINDL